MKKNTYIALLFLVASISLCAHIIPVHADDSSTSSNPSTTTGSGTSDSSSGTTTGTTDPGATTPSSGTSGTTDPGTGTTDGGGTTDTTTTPPANDGSSGSSTSNAADTGTTPPSTGTGTTTSPTVPDTTPPVITLLGDATIHIAQGAPYTDPGATALDNVDGDITSHITITNPVDTTTPGTYTVTYTVSDAAGNAAIPVTRTVIVDAPIVTTPPPTTSGGSSGNSNDSSNTSGTSSDGTNTPPTTTNSGGSTPPQTTSGSATTPTESILIRNGGTIMYQGSIPLPGTGTVSIKDATGATHQINARSVLAILNTIATTTNTFSLSDLEYYASYGSFYLKCLTPTGGSALCDNWQYAIGSTTPGTGIDQTILSGGETIGLYFGYQHQVQLSTTTIAAGGTITATATTYNYTNNTWSPLTGDTFGITVPNPNDQWNPTVISTTPFSANGTATVTITNPGTYTVGIVEDYYSPAYTVTVTPATTSIVSSGGGGASVHTTEEISSSTQTSAKSVFNIPKALAYLESVQSTDGSFGGTRMYTDWAAIAYAADTVSDSSSKSLRDYLAKSTTASENLTDAERESMTLLALGQNPYTYGGTNLIAKITDSFDGTQYGDPTLDNDDIFALIPLSKSGYTVSDPIIQKDVAFVLSKQNIDGSWDESVDMTAAALQALKPFNTLSGVTVAIASATTYIQNAQLPDGGWGSVYTTSWVLQAQAALGTTWTKNGNTGMDYLADQQASDGGAITTTDTLQNRIWATSYAIPAALGIQWSTIMHSVSKPEQVVSIETPTEPTIAQTPLSVPKTESLLKKNTENTQQAPIQISTIPKNTVTPSVVEQKPPLRIPPHAVWGAVLIPLGSLAFFLL